MATEWKKLDAPAPIPMVLHCPACGTQHIDKPEMSWKEALEATGRAVPPEAEEAHAKKWDNPPHRSHQCQTCKFEWRPADVATTGVKAIKTRGANDTQPPAHRTCSNCRHIDLPEHREPCNHCTVICGPRDGCSDGWEWNTSITNT